MYAVLVRSFVGRFNWYHDGLMIVLEVACDFAPYIVSISLTCGRRWAGLHVCTSTHVLKVIAPRSYNASRFHREHVHALVRLHNRLH